MSEEKDEREWQGIALRFVSAVEGIATALGRIADALSGKGPKNIRIIFGSVVQSQSEEK